MAATGEPQRAAGEGVRRPGRDPSPEIGRGPISGHGLGRPRQPRVRLAPNQGGGCRTTIARCCAAACLGLGALGGKRSHLRLGESVIEGDDGRWVSNEHERMPADCRFFRLHSISGVIQLRAPIVTISLIFVRRISLGVEQGGTFGGLKSI